MDPADDRPSVFTIGHGEAPFAEVERLLRIHHVAMLIDVRSASHFSGDFTKGTLTDLCAAAALGYRWMGDRLGDPEISRGFDAGLADVVALNARTPVALLCEERDPDHCHRSTVIAPALEDRGVDVYHILSDGSARRHQPTLGI